MGAFVASQMIMAMLKRHIDLRSARVLLLGLTFKENTPDLRNTRVIDVYNELVEAGVRVDIHDPWVSAEEAKREYDVSLTASPGIGDYQGVIVAVAHDDFRALGPDGIHRYGDPAGHVVYDLKSVLPANRADLRL
jgi:UDP-N-acetyl-D-galactosamine dehydrogenase